MRKFTSNLTVLTAKSGKYITGTAIDGNTAIHFTVANNDLNIKPHLTLAKNTTHKSQAYYMAILNHLLGRTVQINYRQSIDKLAQQIWGLGT